MIKLSGFTETNSASVAARVIFTAHYDTPSNMVLPNLIIPRNLPLYFAYQFGVILLLFLLVGVGGHGGHLLAGEQDRSQKREESDCDSAEHTTSG